MSSKTTTPRKKPAPAESPKVSLRAIYLAAMKEVMADPHKAVAEHDPFLAALVPPASAPVDKA